MLTLCSPLGEKSIVQDQSLTVLDMSRFGLAMRRRAGDGVTVVTGTVTESGGPLETRQCVAEEFLDLTVRFRSHPGTRQQPCPFQKPQ